MSLLRLTDVHLAFGDQPLLAGAELHIEAGERIALVGRNGAGKSSLLRLLAGELSADRGQVVRRQGLRVARLEQAVPEAAGERPIEAVIASGAAGGQALADYLALAAAERPDLAQLERLQAQLDAADGWRAESRVQALINRLSLPAGAAFGALSGGLKRRVMLAHALVGEPDLLLLDEPTNHLDIEAIEQLENTLRGFAGSALLISHDRAFLRRLATRVLDLDRGRLSSWPGDYGNYLRGKTQALAAEEAAAAAFDKKLAEEERWIRQGIKARRTRNEGRVRSLQRLRRERAERRDQIGTVRARLQRGARSGKDVLLVEDLHYRAADGRLLVDGLELLVQRGDRLGLIGPNGAGKTSLIRLLLGELAPSGGRVVHGTGLQIARFDQHRQALDPDLSAQDNVAEGGDHVEIDGQRRHVLSYLQDFLFSPARARAPIRRLSGGERNRLLLAKLFAKPANLLVMDEPTNDLDVETLELLESLLIDYPGTLLLVSHDRAFLDNTVTGVLAFEGAGRVREYLGGYSDWLRQRPAPAAPAAAPPAKAPTAAAPRPKANKLSYKAQRELDALPAQIEALEAQIEAINRALADPDYYRRDRAGFARSSEALADTEAQLLAAMTRWEALESGRG